MISACSDNPPAGPDPRPTDPPVGFVLIPAGSFVMGSPGDELGRTDIEIQHPVTISKPFWMQATEVTNAQFLGLAQWAIDNEQADISFERFTILRDRGGNNDFLYVFRDDFELGYDTAGDSLLLVDAGHGLNPDNPVVGLTWWGAAAYCDWLSLREGREPAYDHFTWRADLSKSTGYRLPTEAEWEYAARSGSGTAFAGSQIQSTSCLADSLQFQGWYCFNAPDWTKAVGQLWPNAFGLYDMHGNVLEFCNDWFASDYYSLGPETDPPGPDGGDFRLIRGGAWGLGAKFSRSALRGLNFPGMSSVREGVRPVLPQPNQ